MPNENKAKIKSAHKKALIGVVLGLLLAVAIYYPLFTKFGNILSDTEITGPTLSFLGQTYTYELADDVAEITRGLSDHEFLNESSSMLFVFQDEGRRGIWMKDMDFALDIIWLDESKRVVHIEQDVSPDTYPMTFYSTVPTKYVIEFNDGVVASSGLAVGDIVAF